MDPGEFSYIISTTGLQYIFWQKIFALSLFSVQWCCAVVKLQLNSIDFASQHINVDVHHDFSFKHSLSDLKLFL